MDVNKHLLNPQGTASIDENVVEANQSFCPVSVSYQWIGIMKSDSITDCLSLLTIAGRRKSD